MKSYLSLIPISAKVHKKQNRMTLFCISISVFLVTAIFGLAETGLRMEVGRLSEKHEGFMLGALFDSVMGQTLLIVAFVLFVLILIAGVLMITGSINCSVVQKTQFFGMMRCVGMSEQQIRRYVRLEALNWCKTAIPVGLLAGNVFIWISLALLRYVVGEEFSDISVWVISIPGIVGGIAMGVITVLLASRKPAKIASSVSPALAVSGTSSMEKNNFLGIRRGMFHIETQLGINHAVSLKKNMFLMAGSFALTIVLFFSFLVLVDLVNYLMPQSHSDADFEIISDNERKVDENLVSNLKEAVGVSEVYGRRSALDIPAVVDGKEETIDIISFDDFEIDCLKKDRMLKRGTAIADVYGDKGYGLTTWDKTSSLKKGDYIQLGEDRLQIAGFLKCDPFTEDGLTHGKITLITSGETFVRLTGKRDYDLVNIKVDDNISTGELDIIRNLVGDDLIDRRDMSTFGTYMAFMIFVYGFLAIIALVALLNIVNSISMSVSARIKQYGAMRAVGMSISQLTKMIVAEASTYALVGGGLGLVIGLIINKVLYGFLIEDHVAYASWGIPVIPILIIVLFIVIAIMLAVISPAMRIRRMSIAETISNL